MYIHKIRLKNIRGFKSLEFDLSRNSKGDYAGWTVFTGDNGSGKSSLLKAITVALIGKDSARSLQASFAKWITSGETGGSIELELMPCPDQDVFAEKGKTSHKKFTIGCTFEQAENGEPAVIAISRMASKSSRVGQRGPWSVDAKGWLSCGYGPFRRVLGASPEAQRLMSSSATTRFVTMFREDASLNEVDVWLKDLQYKSLEKKAEAKEILDNVLKLLRNEFMPNGIYLDHVDSDGVWLKDLKGVKLSWVEMSDGYRAALALLADILRHMIVKFGIDNLFATQLDGSIIIKKSGVVLIDEIDAHLHPEWQRKIGFWMKKHFPNVQFIVSSHSPIICQAADEKGLFHLPAPGSSNVPFQLSDDDYKKIIASKPDKILLSPAFGLENSRSPRAVESRARYSLLKTKERAGAKLSRTEKNEVVQLSLFADDED